MYEENIVIRNTSGLHARPASQLVALANEYESDVEVVFGDKKVNAKSVLSVLTAGIYAGSEVVLRVSGADEDVAAPALSEFMNNLPD